MRTWALMTLLACSGGGGGGGEGGPNGGAADGRMPLVLLISYGSEKKAWFEEQIQAFEATSPSTASGRPIDVEATGKGSGEAMADILSGAASPHVYSPASSAYLTLLNDAWLKQPGHTTPLTTTADLLAHGIRNHEN